MKKIIKKVWDTYCEAMYLAYYPYYRKQLDVKLIKMKL